MTYLAFRQGTSYVLLFCMYGTVRKHPNRAIHATNVFDVYESVRSAPNRLVHIDEMTYLAERQGTSSLIEMYGSARMVPDRAVHLNLR